MWVEPRSTSRWRLTDSIPTAVTPTARPIRWRKTDAPAHRVDAPPGSNTFIDKALPFERTGQLLFTDDRLQIID